MTVASSSTSASSGAVDPSMEDILASIRRILNEEDPAAAAESVDTDAASDARAAEEDVLMLDRSMLVSTPEPDEPAIEEPEPAPPPAPVAADTFTPPPRPLPTNQNLVAPETAAAAASSVDGLLRTLAASRSTQVYRGGPTIEDLVREEIRPLLKDWLDAHLPPMVERLVRSEIERVVGRSVP